jgi:hypothetical protein
VNSPYLKKINPKILEKLDLIIKDSPPSLKKFFVDMLSKQVEVDDKARTTNEISNAFLEILQEYAKKEEIKKYLEQQK